MTFVAPPSAVSVGSHSVPDGGTLTVREVWGPDRSYGWTITLTGPDVPMAPAAPTTDPAHSDRERSTTRRQKDKQIPARTMVTLGTAVAAKRSEFEKECTAAEEAGSEAARALERARVARERLDKLQREVRDAEFLLWNWDLELPSAFDLLLVTQEGPTIGAASPAPAKRRTSPPNDNDFVADLAGDALSEAIDRAVRIWNRLPDGFPSPTGLVLDASESATAEARTGHRIFARIGRHQVEEHLKRLRAASVDHAKTWIEAVEDAASALERAESHKRAAKRRLSELALLVERQRNAAANERLKREEQERLNKRVDKVSDRN